MQDIINAIEIKLGKFVKEHKQLREDVLILKQENSSISAELKEKKDNILTLQEKIRLMNISKSIDGSEKEIEETRFKINEYVREIDKCIALLNK